MSIGIALAGGGMQGVAHIGAIKALEELGIKPDYISGTSSGSIFASMYAMGYTLEEMFEIVKQNYETLVGVEKARIVKAIITYVRQKEIKIDGLINGQKLEDLVTKLGEKKGIKNIADIKIPLAIPTVDTISSKECISISKEYNLYRFSMGTTWQGNGNLFIQWDGTLMGRSTPYQSFKRHLKRHNTWVRENEEDAKIHGLEELPIIPLHGLRHSCATLLNYLEINIIDISKILGHAKSSTTMDIYAHSFENKIKKRQTN